MKKLTLVMLLITTIQLNTKAQKDILANASYKNSFNDNSNYSGKAFRATTNYMRNDSNALIKDHAYYMQKSKNQRIAGWLLLGTGVLVSGVGLLISTSSSSNTNFDNAQAGFIIMGVGAISGIVSIPFMIMSHVNRVKANLLLEKKQTGYGIPAGTKNITALTLSIQIGR